jgi:hypothetical protein
MTVLSWGSHDSLGFPADYRIFPGLFRTIAQPGRNASHDVNEWKRVSTFAVSSDQAPDVVRQLGLKRATSATYQGPATVTVRVYEMKVSTSAFELIQKWRQQDGPAVYSGPFFIVADSTPEAAAGLLEGLRKQLK